MSNYRKYNSSGLNTWWIKAHGKANSIRLRNKLETAIATLNAADKDVIASQASVNQAQSNVIRHRLKLPPIK